MNQARVLLFFTMKNICRTFQKPKLVTEPSGTDLASEMRELRLEGDSSSTRNESGIFVEKSIRQQKSVDSTVETIALSTSMRMNNSLSEGKFLAFDVLLRFNQNLSKI